MGLERLFSFITRRILNLNMKPICIWNISGLKISCTIMFLARTCNEMRYVNQSSSFVTVSPYWTGDSGAVTLPDRYKSDIATSNGMDHLSN